MVLFFLRSRLNVLSIGQSKSFSAGDANSENTHTWPTSETGAVTPRPVAPAPAADGWGRAGEARTGGRPASSTLLTYSCANGSNPAFRGPSARIHSHARIPHHNIIIIIATSETRVVKGVTSNDNLYEGER